jgi:hypothetical protein
MKRLSLKCTNFCWLLSLVIFSIFTGCAGSSVEIGLGDLSSGLSSFAGDPIYDNVSQQVSYKKYGIPKYDNVFRDAAMTSATVRQLRFSLERVVGESESFPANARSTQFGLKMIEMATKQVPRLPQRVNSVITNLKALSPSKDFQGLDIGKVPSVAKSINGAVIDMTNATQDLIQIVKLLKSAIQKLSPGSASPANDAAQPTSIQKTQKKTKQKNTSPKAGSVSKPAPTKSSSPNAKATARKDTHQAQVFPKPTAGGEKPSPFISPATSAPSIIGSWDPAGSESADPYLLKINANGTYLVIGEEFEMKGTWKKLGENSFQFSDDNSFLNGKVSVLQKGKTSILQIKGINGTSRFVRSGP